MSDFFLDQPEATRILEDSLDDARKKELGTMLLHLVQTNPIDYLSPAEVAKYKAAQQSIVDARESAVRNEGNIIIF